MYEWLNHQSIGCANFVPEMVDEWSDEDFDSELHFGYNSICHLHNIENISVLIFWGHKCFRQKGSYLRKELKAFVRFESVSGYSSMPMKV